MTYHTGLVGPSRVAVFYWVLAFRSTAWKVQKRKREKEVLSQKVEAFLKFMLHNRFMSIRP
jgi:hypothetical protein